MSVSELQLKVVLISVPGLACTKPSYDKRPLNGCSVITTYCFEIIVTSSLKVKMFFGNPSDPGSLCIIASALIVLHYNFKKATSSKMPRARKNFPVLFATPDSSNLQGKSKKVRVIGSSKQIKMIEHCI